MRRRLILLPQDPSDVSTSTDVLVDHGLLQVISDEYRLHDLVLEYVELATKMDICSRRLATWRQAHFLARPRVLKRYSEGGVLRGGFYTLVTLWNALTKLDSQVDVKEFYMESLGGSADKAAWRQAGILLRLLVRNATLYSV